METPKVYVLCDANCKWEGMTKEQILTAITQAVNEGTISNIDTGFVQTIKTINGTALKFFVGEQSEYDALTEADKKDLFAIITNDATKEGLLNAIEELQTNLKEVLDGKRAVPWATNADKAKLLNFGAPVLNTAKKLTEKGYYFVRIADTNCDYDTVIYWETGKNIKKTIWTSLDQNFMSTYDLQVDYNGNMSFRYANRWFTDGTYSSTAMSCSIYTVKIGE